MSKFGNLSALTLIYKLLIPRLGKSVLKLLLVFQNCSSTDLCENRLQHRITSFPPQNSRVIPHCGQSSVTLGGWRTAGLRLAWASQESLHLLIRAIARQIVAQNGGQCVLTGANVILSAHQANRLVIFPESSGAWMSPCNQPAARGAHGFAMDEITSRFTVCHRVKRAMRRGCG